MKKIKSFLKHNYKKLIIQFTAIISALVIFCIPASAMSNMYEFKATSNTTARLGQSFLWRVANSNSSYKVSFLDSVVREVDWDKYRDFSMAQITVSPEYDTISPIMYYPLGIDLWDKPITERFYIELPLYAYVNDAGGRDENFKFSLYAGRVYFTVSLEDGTYESYTFNTWINNDQAVNTGSEIYHRLKLYIEPTKPFTRLEELYVNYEVDCDVSYIFGFGTYDYCQIKTGADMPINMEVNSAVIDFVSQEEALINSQKTGLNQAAEMFGSITDNVAGYPELLKGFSVVSQLINNATTFTPGIYIILLISLCLGIFAFVVGMSHSLSSTVDDSMSDESLDRSARRSYEVQKRVQNLRKENYERSKKG